MSGTTYSYKIHTVCPEGATVDFENVVTCNPSATTPEDKWSGALTASCGTITWGSPISGPTMNKPGFSSFTWNNAGCPQPCCEVAYYCVDCGDGGTGGVGSG
jgi:hypothetical protein